MKRFLSLALMVLIGVSFLEAQTVTPEEMDWLVGPMWKGKLSVSDPETKAEKTVAVELLVTKTNSGRYEFVYVYPETPGENTTTTITLNKAHNRLNKYPVVGREANGGDKLKITTVGSGKEDGIKGTFRYTFLMGKKKLEIQKEIKKGGSDDYILLDQYTFSRS